MSAQPHEHEPPAAFVGPLPCDPHAHHDTRDGAQKALSIQFPDQLDRRRHHVEKCALHLGQFIITTRPRGELSRKRRDRKHRTY